MEKLIKIRRIPYEEPFHLQLEWEVSNDMNSAKFDYYDNADFLLKAGEALCEFPIHNQSVYLYEIGSEKPEDRFAYYFRFRVFTVSSTGLCAIQFKFTNNADLPRKQAFEFCIKAEPASLNRLGLALKEFSKLNDEYLVWDNERIFIGSFDEYQKLEN